MATAKQTQKPAVKRAAKAKQKVTEQAADVQEAPGIPYHYNVTFELEDGKRTVADGVLTIGAPVLTQQHYDIIKMELVKHFKMDEVVKGVIITALHRMDTLNLMAVPMPAPAPEDLKAA